MKEKTQPSEHKLSIFDLVRDSMPDNENPHDWIMAAQKVFLRLSNQDRESFEKCLDTTIDKATEIVGSSEWEKSEKNKDKKGSKRYRKNYSDLLEALGAGPRLLYGQTLDERISQYYQYLDHVERCWQQARDCFRAGRYAFAVFFSILTIEETGKLSFLYAELVGLELPRTKPPVSSRNKTPFYHHTKKHCIAAFNAAIVNRRLDRLLGLNRIKSFIDDAANGNLERLRQNCLYSEPNTDGSVIPGNTVSREDSIIYVVLSGEIMEDLLPCFPWDRKRLLDQVQIFERDVGLEVDDCDPKDN